MRFAIIYMGKKVGRGHRGEKTMVCGRRSYVWNALTIAHAWKDDMSRSRTKAKEKSNIILYMHVDISAPNGHTDKEACL